MYQKDILKIIAFAVAFLLISLRVKAHTLRDDKIVILFGTIGAIAGVYFSNMDVVFVGVSFAAIGLVDCLMQKNNKNYRDSNSHAKHYPVAQWILLAFLLIAAAIVYQVLFK